MNYHTRENYEKLYCQLICGRWEIVELYELHEYTNYQLLKLINRELERKGCDTFTVEEIDSILAVMPEYKTNDNA